MIVSKRLYIAIDIGSSR